MTETYKIVDNRLHIINEVRNIRRKSELTAEIQQLRDRIDYLVGLRNMFP